MLITSHFKLTHNLYLWKYLLPGEILAKSTGAKIDRIVHRERKVQKILQKENLEPKKHKYFIMEIPIEQVPFFIKEFKQKTSETSRLAYNAVNVRQYNAEDPKDNKLFTDIFNLVLLTSPDPYRPITIDEAHSFFKVGTFLAFLYGRCVGYAVVTIEETEIGKIGVIAGIGVHPKFRRKHVAQKLAMEVAKWFLSRKDLVKLQCEVYESNLVSQKFISSFGFHIVGELFLD